MKNRIKIASTQTTSASPRTAKSLPSIVSPPATEKSDTRHGSKLKKNIPKHPSKSSGGKGGGNGYSLKNLPKMTETSNQVTKNLPKITRTSPSS